MHARESPTDEPVWSHCFHCNHSSGCGTVFSTPVPGPATSWAHLAGSGAMSVLPAGGTQGRGKQLAAPGTLRIPGTQLPRWCSAEPLGGLRESRKGPSTSLQALRPQGPAAVPSPGCQTQPREKSQHELRLRLHVENWAQAAGTQGC